MLKHRGYIFWTVVYERRWNRLYKIVFRGEREEKFFPYFLTHSSL